jgi:septal ring factor EnvC (AmiA/AmiB activator)
VWKCSIAFKEMLWRRVTIVYGPTSQRWRELHLRVARGDRLSAEDQAVYDATRRELEDNETRELIHNAQQAREELRELEAQRRRLEQRRQELDAEIAAIESTLAPQARELLGAEE